MMRRRELTAALLGSLIIGASRARSQNAPRSVAYFAPSRTQHLINAFTRGLRDLGYVDGQNVRLEYRFADNEGGSIPVAAARLVEVNPAVIVVVGVAAASEVKRMTSTIPIVVAPAGDPVRSGLVESLAAPEANLTGVSLYGSELNEKRLEVFKEAFPGIKSIGALWNANNFAHPGYWEDLRAAGQRLGLDLLPLKAHGTSELSDVFRLIRTNALRGLVVVTDAEFDAARERIVALANEYRVPTIYEHREFTEAGGLLSYGPDIDRLSYRAAAYVDKLLKGARPSALPIEQPTSFELVVNLKAARMLGVIIPPTLLARADEVIE